ENNETSLSDIALFGYDGTAPQSNCLPLSTIQTNPTFDVPFTTLDSGPSGLKEVELWVSNSNDGVIYGPYSLYALKTWPDSTNFSFTGLAGTYYQFYTRAKDNASNYEPAPAVNDTWTYIANYRADLILNGKTLDAYEDPPSTQIDTKTLPVGGSATYPLVVRNGGDMNDDIFLIWDTSGLPAGWSATLICTNNSTDVTPFINSGLLYLGNLAPGQSINFTLYINASATVNFNTMGSVGIGATSGASGARDSGRAIAMIPGLDYIVLTDAPNGVPLTNVPLSAGGSVAAYASGYNNSGPSYVGLVPVNWFDTPDLGTFDNNTGTNTIFTAGLIGGVANITGENTTFNKIDNFTATITGEDTPPVTTLTIGVPSYTAGTDIYVNSSTQFNLTATDDAGSGVASTWYRIWNGTWSDWIIYTGNFTLNGTDGTRYIEHNSTDVAGNNEATKNQTVILDNGLPGTMITVGDPKFGTTPLYVNSSTQFNLTASDVGSGVASTWYRVWNGTWTDRIIYTGNFTLNGTDGVRHIEYGSVDNLGNEEAVAGNLSVVLDNTLPTTTITAGGPKYGTSPLYVNSSTRFNLTSTDGTGSGVASIWYRIDATGTWTKYTTEFDVSGEGVHTIYYNATDNLGQSESTKSIVLTVDNTPPSAQISVGEPKVGTSPVNITSGSEINITSSDPNPGSGVASIWYRVDGTTWTRYTGNFTVPTEGHHNITFNATDNLGQHGTLLSLYVFVDDTPPTVVVTPSPTARAVEVNAGDTVTLTPTDAGVGGAHIEYSTDGGVNWQIYTGPITINENTAILYHATDALGNQGPDQTLTVTIRTTQPPTTDFISEYWWILLIFLIAFLLLLILYLLGKKKKKCARCSRKSASPENDGWDKTADGEWLCNDCKSIEDELDKDTGEEPAKVQGDTPSAEE
ncbi:MAG: chitobiase/beta-hexosaminidase C-terminal domain-containing protein, partial [Candidatus Thermoplasmatota archaeon]